MCSLYKTLNKYIIGECLLFVNDLINPYRFLSTHEEKLKNCDIPHGQLPKASFLSAAVKANWYSCEIIHPDGNEMHQPDICSALAAESIIHSEARHRRADDNLSSRPQRSVIRQKAVRLSTAL